MTTVSLLFADTLRPNTTPRSVHEIRFKQPMHLHAFRIVAEGERPHAETGFEGQTPPTQLTLELFGCEHSTATLCEPLTAEPHRRHSVSAPSSMLQLTEAASAMRCDYVVIRCAFQPCRWLVPHAAGR